MPSRHLPLLDPCQASPMAACKPTPPELPLRPADHVLAAVLPLPPSPAVALAVYRPTTEAPHDAIELSRRALAGHPAHARILTSVRCGRHPVLYLFLVTPREAAVTALDRLSKLQLDHLDLFHQHIFLLQELSSAAPNAVAHFLDAVRTSVLADLSDAAAASPVAAYPQRLEDGFILAHTATPSNWASGWDNGANSRPVVHFRLQLQISYSESQPSHIVIHAIPTSTPYSSLPLSPVQGSPIVLLPYGTPAYYLNSYKGPSNTLVKQFQESLKGLGVAGWEGASSTPSFIIGWIRVENRQGEDKGTLFVWPSSLCFSYSNHHNHRSSLDYIPEMPVPLQSSPRLSQEGTVATEVPIESRHSENVFHQPWPSELHQLLPHSDPPRALHSFTMPKPDDIRFLANEVGGYVDSVVREREKERERLKKEREAGASISPNLPKQTGAASVSMRVPVATTPLPSILSSPDPPVEHSSNLSHAHHAQIFYPSPPQSGQIPPPLIHNTFPDIETVKDSSGSRAPEKLANVPPTPSNPVSGNGYDLFSNTNTWPQPPNTYMGMEMEMDFTMDMDVDFDMEMSSSRTTATPAYNHRPTLNFDDPFTDADFSFFDQPSKAEVSAPALIPIAPSTSVDGQMDLNQPGHSILAVSDETRAFGPSLHLTMRSANGPWTPTTQRGDGPTPQTFDFPDSRAPDLIPSSPGQSPELHSLPQTPSVQLVFDPSVKLGMPINEHVPILFDPIPFSNSHKKDDTKYTFGKFAFLSPSSDTHYSPLPPPTSADGATWRARYDSVTDPRISVVRQLRGGKRSVSPVPHIRNDSFSSAWLDVAEDELSQSSNTDSALAVEISSDTDSEDGNYDESECDSPQLSRPATPPPSYLPPGPTLLHFQFDHSILLAISTPLRSPGATIMPNNIAPFASVPTPVSPAAALGAASEQSKFLESVAFAIAAEFVENPLWAETWKANNRRNGHPSAVWPDDIKGAAELFRRTFKLLDLSTLLAIESFAKLESYDPPFISMGKGDAVIQLLPSALRFWEKLGLGPKGGRKDLEVYVFYEDADEQRRWLVDAWLSAAATSYKARQMGQFVRGCTNPANDALLPTRFDATFRKTLVSFISNIINAPLPIVVLLFVPATAMTMVSPVLRQVLSSSKKAQAGFSDGQIIFHLIPDLYLVDIEHSPKGYPLLDELCNSIYNRVHVGMERHLSRRMHGTSTPTHLLFHEPNFTLSRPLNSRVTYARSAHSSLDVVDRFTLLHVGYQVSPCEKWVLASCVDQRGEEYNLGLWLLHPNDESDAESDKNEQAITIEKVWTFCLEFARKANVEWRMIITKLGIMSLREIQAWTNQIDKERVIGDIDHAPLDVVLVSADSKSPWTLVESRPVPLSPTRLPRSTSTAKSNTHFSDISATFYALFPNNQISVTVPPLSNTYSTSLVSEPSPGRAQELSGGDSLASNLALSDDELPHPIPFIPLSTSTLIRVPSQPSEVPVTMLHLHILKYLHAPDYTDPRPEELSREITRNFYELAILSTTRFRLDDNPILPFHLAAIDSMLSSLDCDWDRLDNSAEP